MTGHGEDFADCATTVIAHPRMVAECVNCAKTVTVRFPRGMCGEGFIDVGDGTVCITYWHKDPSTGKDCRSEVDASDTREARQHAKPARTVRPAVASSLTASQLRCLQAISEGSVTRTGSDDDDRAHYGHPGSTRWQALPEVSCRALALGSLIDFSEREHTDARPWGGGILWSESVLLTDSGKAALEGEMSNEDIRLAQIRAVRELIAGRADDATVRVADLHEALANPIGEFMVDMMTPGPKEVLALVHRTVQQRIDGELTTFQAMVKIRDLCEGFDWSGDER